MEESTSLTRAGEPNTPALPAAQFDPQKDIERAKQAAKALMQVIGASGKHKLIFNGVRYLEFSDYQTIAQFFNHTVGTEWTRPIQEGDKIVGYEAKSVLYNREGVVVGGAEAACMRDERNWATKPAFQLRSMAQTRAMAKALRSRFGFVAVLAGFSDTPKEEMDSIISPTPTKITTDNSNPPVYTPDPEATIPFNPPSAMYNQPSDANYIALASKAQKDLITKLLNQKGYTLAETGIENLETITKANASEVIKLLISTPSKKIEPTAFDNAKEPF